MEQANVRRLIYISSLSVIEPPRGIRQIQTESSPLATNAERFGAYTWGKREAEALVQQRADGGLVDARILRPGALVDMRFPEAPGLLGRRLFGNWYLGFGRSALPLPTCDVRAAAEAVAVCAEQFDEVPTVINLFDPDLRSRRDLLRSFRATGWRGRFVWVPISALAAAVWILTRSLATLQGRKSSAPAVWAVLRPRRFDPARSASLFRAMAASRSVATGQDESASREIHVTTPA
jgi:nucleoside-diphosphate-sugar epimerase